jgi:hypothetical protein
MPPARLILSRSYPPTPPLSLEKMTSVFPARPSASSLAVIRPTLSSTLAIIAAYTALSCPPAGGLFSNRAIWSGFA